MGLSPHMAIWIEEILINNRMESGFHFDFQTEHDKPMLTIVGFQGHNEQQWGGCTRVNQLRLVIWIVGFAPMWDTQN